MSQVYQISVGCISWAVFAVYDDYQVDDGQL